MGKKNTQAIKKQSEKKIPKTQSAHEIAEIMVSNMEANMQNPNFQEEQDMLRDEVRRKIVKERNKRET